MPYDVVTVPLAGTVRGFAYAAGCEDGVAIESLQPGMTVLIETTHSAYQLVVLNVSTRTVLVHGGKHFSDKTTAVLQGSTAGGNFVKAGWIWIGLRMELRVGRRKVVTSPVISIAVQP